MKKFLTVIVILAGVGSLLYILTQKQTQARNLWNETLSKVPGAGCCCSGGSSCCDDESFEEPFDE
jgi:hypothetical protein